MQNLEVKTIKFINNSKILMELENSESYWFNNSLYIQYFSINQKSISIDNLKKLIYNQNLYETKGKILIFCQRKKASKFEIQKKIKSYFKEIENTDLLTIINELDNFGYIDDLNYTKLFINEKFKFLNWSKNKISNKLKQKGIDTNIIYQEVENYFNNIDEIEQISYFAQKKINLFKSTTKNKKLKLINHLLAKGFDRTNIMKLPDALLNCD